MDTPADRSAPTLRTLLVSVGALAVPVAVQALTPDSAHEFELLLWLVALIPAFLLAYHRGWRGAAVALAAGMAALSVTQAVLVWLGRGVEDWPLLLGVVVAFVAIASGIGWVTELLHRARETARVMEAQARAGEARFRALVEDAAELIAIVEPAGTLRYASPAVARLVGDAVAGGGRGVLGRVHRGDRAAARARFAALAGERGGTLRTELRVRGREGGWRTLEVVATNLAHDPAVGGVVVNARDVSAQRRAVEALRESEHRYRRFFQNDLTGDYLADADGTLVECNPRFAEIFGFPSAAAARGAALGDLFGTDEPSLGTLRDRLRRDGWVESLSLRMCARDEREVHVVTNAVGIFDARGELTQLLGYVFDVSEHRRTEEVLRHAQKLEAVGQLAGGVAHDFDNILTAILGFAYLMEQGIDPESPVARYIPEIRSSALRATELTRQLLAFSRRQALQPRAVDPNRAVAASEQMLRRLLPANVQLRVHPGRLSGSVRIDPGGLQQVLLNLTVNARDAMPRGGEIFVSTRAVTLSAAEAARLTGRPPAGDYLVLSVRDTGTGMDAATLPRIFEPFFTTKQPGRGTGLGLSTVHGIVHQSGGYLHVDSTPGAGSTFTVLFPRHDEAAGRDDDDAAAPRDPAAGRGVVLLADDEDAVRRPLRLALELAGFSVLAAGDGEEALRLARSHGRALDLLVTDMVMPGMGGGELVEQLRRRQPDLRVVVVSGYPDRGREGGAAPLPEGCTFVPKPVQPRRLIEVMNEVLHRASP